MSVKKIWYMFAIFAFAVMPIIGCSSGNNVKTTEKGVQLTVDGNVDAKTTAKSAALAAGDANSVTVYDAQDGAALGTASVDSSGKFSGLTFTLASAKTVLVFKATVPQGTFRSIVPLDLSNPPAAGISANNTINIPISQETTDIATAVSTMLGVTGVIGDTGATLASVSKNYTDAAAQVANNGGQVLAYNTSGLQLAGVVTNKALLPAKDASTLTYSDLNDTKLEAEIISAFVPGNKPIVNFIVKDKASGKGVTGLRTIYLLVAQLVAESDGNNSYWKNYTITNNALYGKRPNFDPVSTFKTDGTVNVQGYTIIDHGDGSYTALFATDIKNVATVTYDANLTHRIGVTVQSVAVPGVVGKTIGAYAGPINPQTGAISANFNTLGVATAVYDFIPATGEKTPALAREIVTTEACNQCHSHLGQFFAHAGRRPDVRICVMCHTPQLSSTPNDDHLGDFTTLVHKIHMGNKLPNAETYYGIAFQTLGYPQDIRNCTTCHKGADVDNWKSKPSIKACVSCHNNRSFDATVPTGMVAHGGGAQADNKYCAGCHSGATALYEVAAKHALPASADASLRTLTPTIKAAAVDATTGKLTVTFTVDNNGTAVTDPAAFAAPSFILAKLMPAANGSSSYWQSMINQFRTKDGAKKPVLQGTSEAATTTNPVTYNTAKAAFEFTFALPYAATPGDIRNGFAKAPIKRSNAPYVNDTMLDLPFAINYDASSTYRIGMQFTNNKNNATFDFVPDGVTAKKTRAIVATAACQKCHAGSTFHGRYNIDLCVACHSLNSYDPYTGDANGGDVNSGTGGSNLATVNLQNIIHKIHSGVNLPSNKEGGVYTLNKVDFSKTAYPSVLKNCATCHVEGTGAPVNAANWYTTPTQEGCMSCHDGAATKASHSSYSNATCLSCHASNRAANVKASHRWW